MPYFADLRTDRPMGGVPTVRFGPQTASIPWASTAPSCGQTGMRTLQDLTLIADTIEPLVTASVAVRLMQERGRRIVAVTDQGRLLGLLTLDIALASAPDVTVREIVTPAPCVLDEQTPIRAAAKELADKSLDYAAVTRCGRYAGILTALSLLEELGRSWDPMTGLSWSDRLRDWGIKSLEAGREVTLLFVDLNDFGSYNKRQGHIVGDRVIKALAKTLADHLEPSQDVLVRYGGDEFVLGSTRPRDEIEAVRDRLQGVALEVEGVRDPVTFAIGLSGGKRTRERDRVHYASTVDNLINLASQECLASKPRHQAAEAPPERAQARPTQVQFLSVDDAGVEPTSVSVSLRGTVATGVAVRRGESTLESVVSATAQAIEHAVPGTSVGAEDTLVFRDSDGRVSVLVQGWARRHDRTVRLRAQSRVSKDVNHAAAEAVLQGFEGAEAMLPPEQPDVTIA